MKQIFTIIYLCTWACIIPAANCLASSVSPHALLNTQMNWQLIQLMLNPEQLPAASTLVVMPPPSDQTREYLSNMLNADIEQGIVLRGGKLELEVMAQLYNVRIMLEEELCRNDLMDHSRISYGWIDINAAATGKTIFLSHTNYHYKYHNGDENLMDTPNDDNCLFVAFLQALELETSLAVVANLRNAVVSYLSQAPNIEQTISISLAGDNFVNHNSNLNYRLGSSNPRSMPTTDNRPEQTRRTRYSAEDKARLLQKEQDRPHELTRAERCRLYDWHHVEKLKQYRQIHAEKKKQYRQAHIEEIKQYQKQYQEQYYQAHAEELKQYRQARVEETKQRQQQEQELGRQQAIAKYNEYLQTTADEPKKTFNAWCEQKLKIVAAPIILPQIVAEPDKELTTNLEKLLMIL